MSPTEPESGEIHHGHDLEAGLLSRLREWIDVFPWLRLGRTLRVAASPPLVLLTAVAFAVWWFGAVRIVGEKLPNQLSDVELGTPSWRWLLPLGWTLLVWAPPALLLTRQGALLTAGRTMTGLKPALTGAARRTMVAWLASLVPLLCTFSIGLMMLGIGWLARLLGEVAIIEWSLALLAAVIAIPCGILLFGAVFTIPLSWAALANERDADALDSLSRGYEALFRRPLRLAMYLIICGLILSAVGVLAWGISAAGSIAATMMLQLAGCSPTVPQLTSELLSHFPTVVVLTLMWSLVGGVYLLLRYDTGGQEVEDLWQPVADPEAPLPELPH